MIFMDVVVFAGIGTVLLMIIFLAYLWRFVMKAEDSEQK